MASRRLFHPVSISPTDASMLLPVCRGLNSAKLAAPPPPTKERWVTPGSEGSRAVWKLTEHVDHANGAADPHQARQPHDHLLGVGRVLLLLPVLRLLPFFLAVPPRRRLHTEGDSVIRWGGGGYTNLHKPAQNVCCFILRQSLPVTLTSCFKTTGTSTGSCESGLQDSAFRVKEPRQTDPLDRRCWRTCLAVQNFLSLWDGSSNAEPAMVSLQCSRIHTEP